MTDLARIGFGVDTAPLDKLDAKLDQVDKSAKETGDALTDLGKKSEAAGKAVGKGADTAGKGMGGYVDATGKAGAATDKFNKTGQETRKEQERHGRSVGMLGASYNSLRNVMGGMGSVMRVTGQAAVTAGGAITSAVGGFTRGFMGGLAGAFGPTAIIASIATFVMGIRSLADRAGNLKDFSDTTEVTVRGLQALEKIAAEAGVSSQNLGVYLERLTAQFDDVGKRTGPLYEGLREVNKELANEIANTGDAEKRITLLARAMQQADAQQRAVIAKAAAGRGFGGFIRVMLGVDDAGGLQKAVSDFNRVDEITKQQADRWDTLGDQIAENAKKIKQNIMAPFMEPVLTGLKRFTDDMLELSRAFREFAVSPDGKWMMDWALKMAQLNPISLTKMQIDWVRSKLPESMGGTPAPKTPAAPAPATYPDPYGFGKGDPTAIVRENQAYQEQIDLVKRLTDQREGLVKSREREQRMLDADKKLTPTFNDRWDAAFGRDSISESQQNIAAIDKQIAGLDERIKAASGSAQDMAKNFKPQNIPSWESKKNELQATVGVLKDAATESEIYRVRLYELRTGVEKGTISIAEYQRGVAELNTATRERMAAQRTQIGVASELEIQTAALGRVERQRATGLINDREYELARAVAMRDSKDAAEALQVRLSMLPGTMRYGLDAMNGWKQADQFLVSSFGNVENAVARAALEFKDFGKIVSDVSKAIAADLIKLSVRMGITGPIAQSLGLGGMMGGGGLFSLFGSGGGGPAAGAAGAVSSGAVSMGPFSFASLVGHGGGVFGRDSFGSRVDDARAWDHAPRYHTGRMPLAANERRAIVRDDEGVFTPGQMAAMGRGGKTEVNIYEAPAGAQVSQSEDAQGNQRVDIRFSQMVASATTTPGSPAQRALRGNYGLRPRRVRR